MLGKTVYFLHIPKTSGMKMQHDLLYCSKNTNSINNPTVYIPGEFEFVFDPAIAASSNIICGHFGRNPISAIEGLLTFTILREPFEQFLSLAKYAASQNSVEFNEQFLDAFLNNNNDINSRFEGMSGCDNPQSCFLYSQIASVEYPSGFDEFGNYRFDEQRCFFVEKPNSYNDVKQRLDGIIIGTLKNRNILIYELNKILRKIFNIEILQSNEIINSTPPATFKISKQHKKLIEEKTYIDAELYAKVCEKTKSTP